MRRPLPMFYEATYGIVNNANQCTNLVPTEYYIFVNLTILSWKCLLLIGYDFYGPRGTTGDIYTAKKR